MVTHGEAVYGCPEAPARPAPNVRMREAGHDQHEEVSELRSDHSEPALLCVITDPCKNEDDHQGKGSTDSGQRVGLNASEVKRPENVFILSACVLVVNTGCCKLLDTYIMMEGVYVVSGLQVDSRQKLDRKCSQRR